MTVYLIKIIVCSALFAVFYKVILEKERMHRFNRFYLLGSLIFSFFVPFITFTQELQALPIVEKVITESVFFSGAENAQQIVASNETHYLFLISLTIYVTITTIMFFRFSINLKAILNKAWTNAIIPFRNCKLILLDQSVRPHSFLDYIFLNADDYRSGNIEQEIIFHELVHVKQKHSWDILIIEIVQILFWFNPFIFLYRKAIMLNHEFLADEAVIKEYTDVKAYKILLLEKISEQAGSFITSSFNHSITKKRLLMMTKTKSFRNSLCRQLAIVPLLGIAVFFFSTITIAQEETEAVQPKQIVVPSTTDGATPAQLAEYNEMVDKAKNDKGRPVEYKISKDDEERLQTLFLLMNKEQQAHQIIVFRPLPPPMKKSIPTEQQIEDWKDPKMFGVWIDGKRINNEELNGYTNTDFGQLFVSKLEKNATNYGKHFYQVDLMTNAHYSSYYKRVVVGQNKYYMNFRVSQ
ncbi:M56 family metallopeptidase [uncultured Cyclobacterium sp.]|uniref:M56 family metallopeptidase n=1 Tax=uncultured Cyclobacterium sp. TaxID=453820 RepID=UPI0030EB2D7C|tara:strand:- start:319260 stop:320657 length:1398 start_codon:yes stop_codon:yes gene_type:complete